MIAKVTQRLKLTTIEADSRFAPSQWEMSLQSNAVSHWLGANLESTLAIQRLGDFYYKDNTVVRPSYLYNGNPHYWQETFILKQSPAYLFGRWYVVGIPPIYEGCRCETGVPRGSHSVLRGLSPVSFRPVYIRILSRAWWLVCDNWSLKIKWKSWNVVQNRVRFRIVGLYRVALAQTLVSHLLKYWSNTVSV